jgi:hypothetical protein
MKTERIVPNISIDMQATPFVVLAWALLPVLDAALDWLEDELSAVLVPTGVAAGLASGTLAAKAEQALGFGALSSIGDPMLAITASVSRTGMETVPSLPIFTMFWVELTRVGVPSPLSS